MDISTTKNTKKEEMKNIFLKLRIEKEVDNIVSL